MAYDGLFFKKYHGYLQEKRVRNVHNRMFDYFTKVFVRDPLYVIDFGCGLHEFYDHAENVFDYVGVDSYNHFRDGLKFIQADYTTVDPASVKVRLGDGIPNAFVSLFSAECVLSPNVRYYLYRDIFRDYPTIQYGMVSGFFYQTRKSEPMVHETDGIVSYQSNERQEDWVFPEFTEFRSYIPCPSSLFGQDVVEVWKFFIRNRKVGNV